MGWQDLWAAMCLVLVLEGILPFLSPRRWKGVLRAASELDDRSIRVVGLVSMVVGTGLLYLIH